MKKLFIGLFFLILATEGFSETILFIGDSHSVGQFGRSFDQHLRSAGHKVASFGSCGSVPRWWQTGQKTNCGFFSVDFNGTRTDLKQASTPLIKDLLTRLQPQIVVMEFGGNYRNFSNAEFVINDVKSIVKQVKDSGAACMWITNPDSRNNREASAKTLELIQKGVGQDCPIFISSQVTKYPEVGGDGIHYWGKEGTAVAKNWAQLAFEAFLDFYDYLSLESF